MLSVSLHQLAEVFGCSYQQKEQMPITGVAIDSRNVQPGDLFVAIAGKHSDGHLYLAQALKRGAAAVVISKDAYAASVPNYLLVEDGISFIQQFAGWLRRQVNIPVIGVTGSTGKTSTKDLLKTILEAQGQVVATEKNYNNELGLPLTLCKLTETTQAMVVEMGMRGLGQIDFLANIAQPNYGIITNIGMVHGELLGTLETIAQAKCELLAHIPPEGTVVLNIANQDVLLPWVKAFHGRVLWFSMEAGKGHVWADQIEEYADRVVYQLHWGEETHSIYLNIPGRHNVGNSLAAIAIARTLGVSWEQIQQSLQQVTLTQMRLTIMENQHQIRVINDAYNANPDSVKAALRVLVKQPGNRKIAVLGDMYELGQYEQVGHRLVGQEAVNLKLDIVIGVGKLGKIISDAAIEQNGSTDVYWVEENQKAAELLLPMLQPQDVVLVKGSRGMQMEEIVQKIMR